LTRYGNDVGAPPFTATVIDRADAGRCDGRRFAVNVDGPTGSVIVTRAIAVVGEVVGVAVGTGDAVGGTGPPPGAAPPPPPPHAASSMKAITAGA
jgi:hypothetical protein